MTTTSVLITRWAGVGAVTSATLARVALGVLWLHEGIVKYRAGFGRADILLVVQSTASNERVPSFYRAFTCDVVGHVPSVFGIGVPLIELALGVALILGIATLPAALLSAFELCNYWAADQLVAQYPVMLVLSVGVAAFATRASRYGLGSALVTGKLLAAIGRSPRAARGRTDDTRVRTPCPPPPTAPDEPDRASRADDQRATRRPW